VTRAVTLGGEDGCQGKGENCGALCRKGGTHNRTRRTGHRGSKVPPEGRKLSLFSGERPARGGAGLGWETVRAGRRPEGRAKGAELRGMKMALACQDPVLFQQGTREKVGGKDRTRNLPRGGKKKGQEAPMKEGDERQGERPSIGGLRQFS